MIWWLLERDLIPDPLIRIGIRRLLAQRLKQESADDPAVVEARKRELVEELRRGAVAVHTDDANDQHYEVPTELYEQILGRHLKYSSGYWPDGLDGLENLDESERLMLELSTDRAQLRDGQQILELGCGWGSWTLFMAERFPNSHVTGVSNSAGQRRHILAQAEARGLTNVDILTKDVNELELGSQFDRVVSIEMFEHMRNYERLFEKVASWLKPDGRCFVHVFCHKEVAYPFEVRGAGDWMARYFFTGGMMPSVDLFERFPRHLRVAKTWVESGTHYQKTSEAWLAKMDRNMAAVEPILRRTYGDEHRKFKVFWRVFFMACAELFGYRGGDEWKVAHYLFERAGPDGRA